MSEADKLKRRQYQEQRKKWITVQAFMLVILTIIFIISSFLYTQLNKTHYIDYTESSSADYMVQYKDNSFLEEWQEPGQAYVTEIIKSILADFEYNIAMDASDVSYDYSYSIVAVLEIHDNYTDELVYHPEFELKPKVSVEGSKNPDLHIAEQISIDYNYFNNIAVSFAETYGITDADAVLRVNMQIDVLGSSGDFVAASKNSHIVSLNVPLASKTISINMSSSVPQGESKILAVRRGLDPQIFKNISIASLALEAVLACVLIAFIKLSCNEAINYSNKIKRIVNNYKSFIQRVTNGFDTYGYQIVNVSTIEDLLSIRDTIQSPILMAENDDQTCTRFLIPTNTKILYTLEIKVDNYDELYANAHDDVIEFEKIEFESACEVADEVAPVTEKHAEPATVSVYAEESEVKAQSQRSKYYEHIVVEADEYVIDEGSY